MSSINKQTFLAELGKLLTFMYDEDRQDALALYGRIFDEVSDEQSLLQQLQSPTRQAVVIARAYDAKTSRLSDKSERRNGAAVTEDGVPKFITVIEDIEEEALAREARYASPLRGQRSLFDPAPESDDDSIEEINNSDPDGVIAPGSLLYAIYKNEQSETEQAPAEEQEAPQDAPPEDMPADSPDAIAASLSLLDFLADNAAQMISGETEVPATSSSRQEAMDEADHSSSNTFEEFPADEVIPSKNEVTEEEPGSEEETEEHEDIENENVASSLQKESDAVSEFLSGFAIDDETSKSSGENKRTITVRHPVRVIEEESKTRTVRTTSTPLAILFTIIAIPICLLLLALLLIPTLSSAVLAACSVCGGAIVMTSAFSGFAVFADILVVLGAGLILLALGLLFLWLFIWLIAAGMVGVIRGAVALGRKICTSEKEVIE